MEPDLLDQKPSIPPPQTPYIHPTYQSPQQPQPQVTVHDLKGDPWLDPKAEPPLEESAVDALQTPNAGRFHNSSNIG